MNIQQLIVELDREDHIARHRVTVAGANEVVFGAPFVRRVKHDRY